MSSTAVTLQAGLPVAQYAQRLAPGFHFPTRMTVLPLAGKDLALISPVPIGAELAGELATCGSVKFLIAPNLLHHLYLSAALERFPHAQVLAPAGLAAKCPGVRIDASLQGPLPDALLGSVDVLQLQGVPSIDEYVFFHRQSRTLVVTDLVFHLTEPRGWLTHLMLRLGRTHGRLAPSRIWQWKAKDKAALRASLQALLALPFDNLIMAHGDVISGGAHARLSSALAPLLA